MGEIIAEIELENAVDHELVKAGHLEDSEVRRATAGNGDRAGARCTAPSSGDGGP